MHEASVVATELARRVHQLIKRPFLRVLAVIIVVLVLVILTSQVLGSRDTSNLNCAFRISNSTSLPVTKGDTFQIDTCLKLEVASSNSSRTLGLSGRKELARDQGMLFDFGQAGEYCMWMKDMRFSLDMLWLNDNKEIVYMIENVTSDTYPKSFCGPQSARYVIEVNKDIIKAADLHVGQRLMF